MSLPPHYCTAVLQGTVLSPPINVNANGSVVLLYVFPFSFLSVKWNQCQANGLQCMFLWCIIVYIEQCAFNSTLAILVDNSLSFWISVSPVCEKIGVRTSGTGKFWIRTSNNYHIDVRRTSWSEFMKSMKLVIPLHIISQKKNSFSGISRMSILQNVIRADIHPNHIS